ncbi:MAG: DegT/DnrJ/EryC1/StrS family aminotransferase [Jaaginema sp. PMC 1079.18]|nr:DegT/DnrJ/EryC1/StrS family aminotransferase [Jaaginema sp. PMC 1080.18]MEC4851261.1 DegT/DnrJ/EryC1/StrS family aminotransferase [Jaaginema sp. PMC 1079.18]MEC4864472.1 DegT/DnrJ/EryC1/StrS family aminotransferase [Jaaginema sp. PMC 1078.18]
MTVTAAAVPFVDFSEQHQPIQAQIDAAIQQVVQQGNFILGQDLEQFEQAFAAACGVDYAVGVGSGTDAIALGLQAAKIGAGDEVLVPVNTFIATVIGVITAGATPILVDCDPETALIDLEAAAKLVTKQTKAIIAVHLYGQMVSPQKLQDFADSHNLLVFEDAAQAHLASREGKIAGSLGMGAAFSFYPSKNLGAFGDGGIFITNNTEVARRVKASRNYGAAQKYVHTELGTNSRLDNLQAAILNVKLPHLKGWNESRNEAAQAYDRAFETLGSQGIIPLRNNSGEGHIYHLYVIRIRPEFGQSRDTVQAQLQAQGIQTGIHYPIPCHLQPAYDFLGYEKGDFPHAELLAKEILSLPMFPGLTGEQVDRVVSSVISL